MQAEENYRALSSDEIKALEAAGCRCGDWHKVRVSGEIDSGRFSNVNFSGQIRLGEFTKPGCGVYDARIADCVLHDNCLVRSVSGEISRYEIGNGAVIDGLQSLRMVSKDSTFANGLAVKVMMESGGREVVMHDRLTAQEAYLQAFLSGDHPAKQSLRKMASDRQTRMKQKTGIVGKDAVLRGCGIIEDCYIAEGAQLQSVEHASCSMISGSVGTGSVITQSIVCAGGKVGERCMVEQSFVASGAILDKGFSAEHSLFFANSECLRGEACSVFAGPFTVSHHKSTLLLAGLYSFYNAGSGTNFSNHRYKLGPVHQGVLERGCKNGSGSYLLWPSHIGAFTTVIGKHTRSLDISIFPFSLLLEQNGKSLLLPGANLFTIGIERDLLKWPERDCRDEAASDRMHFAGYSPYTLQRVVQAHKKLKKLAKHYSKHVADICRDFTIPEEYINKALAKYHAALNLYYGGVVASSLEKGSEFLQSGHKPGEWFDLCGLLLPEYAANNLLTDISGGRLGDSQQLLQRLDQEIDNYSQYEEEWVCQSIGMPEKPGESKKGKALIREVLQNWTAAARVREDMLLRDMAKEYAEDMQIGFGLLGDRQGDFTGCRGEFSAHPLTEQIKKQTAQIEERAEALLIKY